MTKLTEIQLRERLLEGMCIAARGDEFMGIDCLKKSWEKFVPSVADKSVFLRIINSHLYNYFLERNCVCKDSAVISGIELFAKEYVPNWRYWGEVR